MSRIQDGTGNGGEWLSTKAAGARLGIADRTVYRLIDTGQLRAHRMGRVIRIRASDVESYLAGSVIAPGTLGRLHGGTPSATQKSTGSSNDTGGS